MRGDRNEYMISATEIRSLSVKCLECICMHPHFTFIFPYGEKKVTTDRDRVDLMTEITRDR